jgi:hypothetical protein
MSPIHSLTLSLPCQDVKRGGLSSGSGFALFNGRTGQDKLISLILLPRIQSILWPGCTLGPGQCPNGSSPGLVAAQLGIPTLLTEVVNRWGLRHSKVRSANLLGRQLMFKTYILSAEILNISWLFLVYKH